MLSKPSPNKIENFQNCIDNFSKYNLITKMKFKQKLILIYIIYINYFEYYSTDSLFYQNEVKLKLWFNLILFSFWVIVLNLMLFQCTQFQLK